VSIGPLAFATPSYLWLLAIVIAALMVDALRGWGTPARRRTGMATRAALLACLVLALADPRWQRRRDAGWVVFVVDRSASISDAGLATALARVDALRSSLGPDVRTGLVLADGAATVAIVPGQEWARPSELRGSDDETTDIGAAIDVARALIPEGDAGAIVLLSDGRPTAGERRANAIAARVRGVAVHVVTVVPERKEAGITAIVLDESITRPGATSRGRVELDGGAEPFKGKVVLSVGGAVIHSQNVEIAANESREITFDHSLELSTPEGPLAVDAELIPEGALEPSARSETKLIVGSRPKVMMLAADPRDSEHLADALRAEAMDVQVRTLDARDFPREIDADTDLVIIANAPAASLVGAKGMSDELLSGLAKWVDSGGGLLVIGGPRAFDMGGYHGSPIERVLPVRLDPVDPLVEPAATIIVVLDKSGSMSMRAGDKSKMELADEGVVASLQMLRPFDHVGVASVTTQVTWDVNVQPVSEALDLEQKILSIRAGGGGIYVYDGLEAAQKALQQATTPLRHVLLFSDCADSEQQQNSNGRTALELTDQMLASGITISVIGIGHEGDKDTAFLKDVADRGGGKFYLTDDATKLRGLFVEETERLVDNTIQEVEFLPRVVAEHRMTSGVDYGAAPKLTGYQRLKPRRTAEVLLEGPEADPILVTWRYGLGQVVAWASDAGIRWAKNWVSWKGYSQHWTQVARFSLRTHAGDATAVEVDFAGQKPVARLVRRDAAGMTLDGAVRLRVKTAKGPRELSLSAREPGLYEADLDIPPSGAHVLEVVDETGKVIREHKFVVPPAEEHRHRTADDAWLRELAARTVGSVDPGALFVEVRPSSTSDHLQLWPFLVFAAALLVPLDAFLRRLSRTI